MHAALKKMESAVRNPYIELLIGVILIYTGFLEAGGTIVEDVSNGNLGAHHGVIALGFAHAIQAVPAILTAILLFVDADRKQS